MKKRIILIAAVAAAILIFIFLIPFLADGTTQRGFIENNTKNKCQASFMYFDGVKTKSLRFPKDKEIHITCSVNCESGNLQVLLISPDGKTLFENENGTKEYSFIPESSSKYTVKFVASQAKGNYDFTWAEK
ncbi:hypothetical protein CCDG5_1758 [[Clostridium] cellulosi]|uniref:Uncharacterized protein n=1 Tax=[Clostridium] cellulosi TaxID=29343 RepID=A0A078KQV9_9FIRM|nr:hypothetical protein CCDG5_1758 [[Clostridium] cellulosi]